MPGLHLMLLIGLLAPAPRPADAQALMPTQAPRDRPAGPALLRPARIVLHLHPDIKDQRFVPPLVARLQATLRPPITVQPARFDMASLRHPVALLDGQAVLAHFADGIAWREDRGAIHVLLIADDMRLAPANFNFAVSLGSAASEAHASVVSLSRLQQRPFLDGGDRAPERTAERVFKLVAKNVARMAGYTGSTACLFAFARSLAELDAVPDSFCEPDLSRLVDAGIANPPPR